MNRTNSMANSVSSATSSKLYSSNNLFSLSPLIKLERIVYRLNSVISINLDSYNEFELKKHLKLLLEYQKEISKLKEIVNENSKIKLEFEYENRIQWIESRIELLNKIIKELETMKSEIKDEFTEDTKITDTTSTVIDYDPVTSIFNSDNNSIVNSDVTATVNSDTTSIVNSDVTAIVNSDVTVSTNRTEATHRLAEDDNDTTEQSHITAHNNLIDEILPPKPETLLSLPKSLKSPSESSAKDTLVFSEDIQNDHNNLTNELIATVQLIKRNNLHIQNIVKSDDKIITQATGLLATNSDSMQKEGKNLKSYSKTAWVSFWKMLGIMLFVCFTFIFVYIFIRLT